MSKPLFYQLKFINHSIDFINHSKMKLAVFIVAFIAIFSASQAQEELPRMNLTIFNREDGDELLYHASLSSVPTETLSQHMNILEWDSLIDKYSGIIIDVPQSVSVIIIYK